MLVRSDAILECVSAFDYIPFNLNNAYPSRLQLYLHTTNKCPFIFATRFMSPKCERVSPLASIADAVPGTITFRKITVCVRGAMCAQNVGIAHWTTSIGLRCANVKQLGLLNLWLYNYRCACTMMNQQYH